MTLEGVPPEWINEINNLMVDTQKKLLSLTVTVIHDCDEKQNRSSTLNESTFGLNYFYSLTYFCSLLQNNCLDIKWNEELQKWKSLQ